MFFSRAFDTRRETAAGRCDRTLPQLQVEAACQGGSDLPYRLSPAAWLFIAAARNRELVDLIRVHVELLKQSCS